jgi:recombination protein RecA
MSQPARAALEAALRVRQLDRTLTTALPPLERTDPAASLLTGVAALDACLRGGLPRGQLSEITGPRSSGRTALLLQLVAAASRRGEIAALVDTFDQLDVASACAAGIDLDRMLWVRGHAIAAGQDPGRGQGPLVERSVERALKALNLVLQAGGFAVVAIDLADVPVVALKRIPFTTWLRVQRTIEGSDTACVLVTPEALARSAGGITLSLGAAAEWAGTSDRARRLARLTLTTRIVSPRRRVGGEVRIAATATDSDTPRHRGTEAFNPHPRSSVPPCLGVSESV